MDFNGVNSIEQSGSDLSNGGSINGDLDVSGTTTTDTLIANTIVSDISVEDGIIELAINNTADNLNTGIISKYVSSGDRYAGLIRNKDDKKFYLLNNDSVKPTETSTISNSSGTLKLANLEAGQVQVNGSYILPLTIGADGEVMKINAGNLEFDTLYDQNLNTTDTAQFQEIKFDKTATAQIREISYRLNDIEELSLRYQNDAVVIRSNDGPIMRFNGADQKAYIGFDEYSFPNTVGAEDKVLGISGGELEFIDVPNRFDQELNQSDAVNFTGITTVGPAQNTSFVNSNFIVDATNTCDVDGDVIDLNGATKIDLVSSTINLNSNNIISEQINITDPKHVTTKDYVDNFNRFNQELNTSSTPAFESLVIDRPATFDDAVIDYKTGGVQKWRVGMDNAAGDYSIADDTNIFMSCQQGGDVSFFKDITTSKTAFTNDQNLVTKKFVQDEINAIPPTTDFTQINMLKDTGDTDINFTEGGTAETRIHAKTGDSGLYIQRVVAGVPQNVIWIKDEATKEIHLQEPTYVNNLLTVADTNASVDVKGSMGDATLILDKKLPINESKVEFKTDGVSNFTIGTETGNVLKVKSDVNTFLEFDGNEVNVPSSTWVTAEDIRITDGAPASFHRIFDNAGYLEISDLSQNPITRIGADDVEIKKPVAGDYHICAYNALFGFPLHIPAQMYMGLRNVIINTLSNASMLAHPTENGTKIIPANSLTAFSHISLKNQGIMDNQNKGFIVDIFLQGTLLATINVNNPEDNQGDCCYELELDFYITQIVGSIYNVIIQGEFTYMATRDNLSWSGKGVVKTTESTGFDVTQPSSIDVQMRWLDLGNSPVLTSQSTVISFSTTKYP